MTNISVESLHFYACNSYYSLLERLRVQNLSFQKGSKLPISKKLIDCFLGPSGILCLIENQQELPLIQQNELVDFDQGKLEVKFSFLKGKIKYNLSRVKEAVRNLVISPTILKYLKIVTFWLKTKDVSNYAKKLKKFSQLNQNKNTIF